MAKQTPPKPRKCRQAYKYPQSPSCSSDDEFAWTLPLASKSSGEKLDTLSSSDEDDKFLERITRRSSLVKTARVSIGSDLKRNIKTRKTGHDDSSASSGHSIRMKSRSSMEEMSPRKHRRRNSETRIDNCSSAVHVGIVTDPNNQQLVDQTSDQDSVDTAELTSRLKRNLASKQHTPMSSPKQMARRNLMGDGDPLKLPCLSTPKINVTPNEITCQFPTESAQDNVKRVHLDTEDDISDGDQSGDTVELTCRLTANLCAAENNGVATKETSANESIAGSKCSSGDRYSTLPSQPGNALSDTEEELSEGGQSCDTTELTRRLRVNLCPNALSPELSKTPTNSVIDQTVNIYPCDGWDEKYKSCLNEEKDGPTEQRCHLNCDLFPRTRVQQQTEPPESEDRYSSQVLHFRLPSQSESSSDDDSMNENSNDGKTNDLEHDHPSSLVVVVDDDQTNHPVHMTATICPLSVSRTRCTDTLLVGRTSTQQLQSEMAFPKIPVQEKKSHLAPKSTRDSSSECKEQEGRQQRILTAPSTATQMYITPTYNKDALVSSTHDAQRVQITPRHDPSIISTHHTIPQSHFLDKAGGPVPSRNLHEDTFGSFESFDSCPNDRMTPSNLLDGRSKTAYLADCTTDDVKQKANKTSPLREAKTDEELFHEGFIGASAYQDRPIFRGESDFITLLDSDSDEDGQNYQPAPSNQINSNPSIIHSGLHTTQKSPRFNIASRAFPKHRHSSFFDPRSMVLEDISEDDDDSDYDDSYRPSQKVARRITEDHSIRIRQKRPRRVTTMESSISSAIPVEILPISADEVVDEQYVSMTGLPRPWRRNQKPRIRDPTTSNPLNAASVASRTHHQRPSTLHTGPERFGTSSIIQQRSSLQNQRNDVHGGSGAGVAGFTFRDNGGDMGGDAASDDGNGNSVAKRPARKSTTRKTSTSRKRPRSDGTRRTTKRRKGGGRRGGWSTTGRGQGKAFRSPRGGRSRENDGSVWGNGNEGDWKVSEAFTREDQAMQRIGGAEISF